MRSLQPLTLVERTLKGECPPSAAPSAWFDTIERLPEDAVEGIGRRTVNVLKDVAGGLAFFGRTVTVLVQGLARPRRLRPISVARHVYETGITAVPIVSLIAFLISVILAYMGAQELRQFGAEVFVVDLVTIGVLRELGVLLTAIIVAGRSGTAFAAEIGSMQLNEEVDALRAMGVNPIELLVLPRVIGLVIALPLLTLVADIIGLAGGALLCHNLLGMPLPQYLYRVQYSIAPTTFWVGVVKAPVFAVLIALSGCYCGMLVRGSSRELGRLTTVAVVGADLLRDPRRRAVRGAVPCSSTYDSRSPRGAGSRQSLRHSDGARRPRHEGLPRRGVRHRRGLGRRQVGAAADHPRAATCPMPGPCVSSAATCTA